MTAAACRRPRWAGVAWIDGPYGVFTVDREADAKGFVMIAGGVGITPILANLHALQARRDPRPVHLLYANKDWDDVPFREQLAGIARDIDLHVTHVIEEPPEPWDTGDHTGAKGRIDADMLDRLLPGQTRDWPHMMCGPAPMLAAIRVALADRGTPLSGDPCRNLRDGVTDAPASCLGPGHSADRRDAGVCRRHGGHDLRRR